MDTLKVLKFVKSKVLFLALYFTLLGVVSVLLVLTTAVISAELKTTLLVTALSLLAILTAYLTKVFINTMKTELTEEEKIALGKDSGLY